MQQLCRKIGFGLLLIGASPALAACAQDTTRAVENDSSAVKIKRVFLNVRGEAKPAQRMWTSLDLELENRNFMVVNSQATADAVVDAELNSQAITEDIGLEVVHLHFHAHGKDEQQAECAGTRGPDVAEGGEGEEESGPNVGALLSASLPDTFPMAASSSATDVRTRFPKAHTIKIDDTSDMSQSKAFRSEFEKALKTFGFDLVNQGAADVLLRVDLALEKIAVDEHTVHYSLKVANRHGLTIYHFSGNDIVSAKLKAHAPQGCPAKFEDLHWIEGGYPFEAIARDVVKQLSNSNSREPEAPLPSQK